MSYFLGILWHIFVCDVQSVEYYIPGDSSSGERDNFCKAYMKIPGVSNSANNVKVWYFALTTLSTIGYGDFHPISL